MTGHESGHTPPTREQALEVWSKIAEQGFGDPA
jgi:hypothetical protein